LGLGLHGLGQKTDALLRYAEGNQVIMGAATHGLQMQRVLATVPIKAVKRAFGPLHRASLFPSG
jgi:hypothetical protein